LNALYSLLYAGSPWGIGQGWPASNHYARLWNHTHDYIKTKMTTTDFDQALVDSWEIVLQSPDGYVLLRKAKT